MKKILILIDYRQQFWLTTRHKQASFIVSDLEKNFQELGYEVKVKEFSELDLATENYANWYVVYQSTEDGYLLYNSYIEDIVLALREQGAILLPDFKYNRAHHNKVFMELLRTLSPNQQIKKISSKFFGTFEEYQKFVQSDQAFFPQVVKLAEGAQSKNVILVKSPSEISRVRKMMRFFNLKFYLTEIIKAHWPKRYPNFKHQSYLRKKIVVQNFIPNLDCDYKILAFADKFYVLQRGVRPGDFRASGSGLFEFRKDIPADLLDFARDTYLSFNVPFISMDIAQNGSGIYLIEFQFLSFGTYTLEKAQWHFEKNGSNWQCVEGQDNLEKEFCRAINFYINKNQN